MFDSKINLMVIIEYKTMNLLHLQSMLSLSSRNWLNFHFDMQREQHYDIMLVFYFSTSIYVQPSLHDMMLFYN